MRRFEFSPLQTPPYERDRIIRIRALTETPSRPALDAFAQSYLDAIRRKSTVDFRPIFRPPPLRVL